ncbi:hypothetical protein OIU79_013173 [Salix purpurea]|uniref:Uncharacterized protein n=1 Tax=Salix purpurea TaxID=77065 RepID=A0A9Q0Q5H7_SALPP|nr:hypothetical protein OIU79_013173 [Salix purpurea]
MGEANNCCDHGCRQCGGDRSVGKESAEGKRREGVDMEVFGGDTVSKRRVASGDGFMGRRRYAKRVRSLSERGSGRDCRVPRLRMALQRLSFFPPLQEN